MAGIDFTTEAQDLWKNTQAKYLKKAPAPLVVLSERHKWPTVNRRLQKDKIVIQGGPKVSLGITIRGSTGTTHVAPGQIRDYSVADVRETLDMPWVTSSVDDVLFYREFLTNVKAGGEQLYNLAKQRLCDAIYRQADDLESRAWKSPDSSTDKLNPCGYPYYITPITGAQVTAQGGAGKGLHQGANPYYSDGNVAANCAGVDASLDKNKLFRNYNDTWSNATGDITASDVRAISRALRAIKFEVPFSAKGMVEAVKGGNMRGCTNETLIANLEEQLRANNDNLGTDIVKYQNMVLINGAPIEKIDDLDADTTNPLYLIDEDQIVPVVLQGDFFRRQGPMTDARQPDTMVTLTWLTYNYAVLNRRALAIISYVAAA